MLRLIQKAYRELYWFPRHVRAYFRHGRPRRIIFFGGCGFGDDLLLSCVAKELRARNERRIAVLTRLTEIFDHSPDVDSVIDEDWVAIDAGPRFGVSIIPPSYYLKTIPPETDVPTNQHLITAMCQSIGLRGRVALRTYFYLTQAEKTAGRYFANQAVIQCTSADSTNFSPNKNWVAGRYQEVVDRLQGQFNFIQLGGKNDPLLKGATDLRGKTTIRESAAILSNSTVAITYPGFLMHLARSVDCRSVTIYGGRERPDQSGYICNENLYTPLPCSPCWRRWTCDWGRPCLSQITSEDVASAALRIKAKFNEPLEIAYEEIAATPTAFILPPYSDPKIARPIDGARN